MGLRHMWQTLRGLAQAAHALCPHRNATLRGLSIQMLQFSVSSMSSIRFCSCCSWFSLAPIRLLDISTRPPGGKVNFCYYYGKIVILTVKLQTKNAKPSICNKAKSCTVYLFSINRRAKNCTHTIAKLHKRTSQDFSNDIIYQKQQFEFLTNIIALGFIASHICCFYSGITMSYFMSQIPIMK